MGTNGIVGERDGVPVYGNFINGEWVASEATFENRNPARSSEVIGHFAQGTSAAADAAALSWWSTEMTSAWNGACGLRSLIETAWSLRPSTSAGTSPATILQKMQSGAVSLMRQA